MNYQRLNNARIKLGWSMERTAEESKIPLQTTKNVLTGISKNSRTDTVKALADALGVPVAEVFADEEILKEEVIEEVENKVIKEHKADEVSVIALKEIYESQIALINKNNEEHIKNIREHYERHTRFLKRTTKKDLPTNESILIPFCLTRNGSECICCWCNCTRCLVLAYRIRYTRSRLVYFWKIIRSVLKCQTVL